MAAAAVMPPARPPCGPSGSGCASWASSTAFSTATPADAAAAAAAAAAGGAQLQPQSVAAGGDGDPEKPQQEEEQLSLRLRGTSRMEIRAPRPRNVREQQEQEAEQQQGVKRRRREEPSTLQPEPLHRAQVLRISAGRAAAAAGIHPFADVWELFVELVYQDLPEMLLVDAARAGIEVVSPAVERARLVAKSGQAQQLEAVLAESRTSLGIEGPQAAQEAVRGLVQISEKLGQLMAPEAAELLNVLQSEINTEFGARHEDAAIVAYAAQVGVPVYGEQRRVSVPLPRCEPSEALAKAFPMRSARADKEKEGEEEEEPLLFRLTGFVDGMVDMPRGAGAGASKETMVVEVKHRMGRIADPPQIYDIVQLGSYCRAFGCSSGQLVQCLRSGPSLKTGGVGVLKVTHIDYSEGSSHRKGWDKQVLPSLYKIAEAVYRAREDPEARMRLLEASKWEPPQRWELVAEHCPHLAR